MIVVQRTLEDEKVLARAGMNPKDLADDGTDYAGIVVMKPWGQERQLHRGGEVCVWRLEIRAEAATSLHCHPGKRTQLILESGDAVLWTLERYFALRPGDCVHIEAGAFHRTATRGGCALIEVESPPNKRDLVRIGDHYGRAGKGYERQIA